MSAISFLQVSSCFCKALVSQHPSTPCLFSVYTDNTKSPKPHPTLFRVHLIVEGNCWVHDCMSFRIVKRVTKTDGKFIRNLESCYRDKSGVD